MVALAGGRLKRVASGSNERFAMRRPPHLSSVSSLCLLALGCSVKEPYPRDWADLLVSRADQCADISGAYYNSCIPASGSFNCLDSGGLAALLFRKYSAAYHPKLSKVTRVTIEQPHPYRLVVKAWKGSELARREEIELAPGDCGDDGVLIRGGPTLANIENAAGFGTSSAVFQKDENGDLVARVKIHFTGIVLLVPASFTGTDWYRFEAHSDKDVEVEDSGAVEPQAESPGR